MKTQHHYIVKVGEEVVLDSSIQQDFEGFVSPEAATTCGIIKAIENRLGMYEVIAITINTELDKAGETAHNVLKQFTAERIKSKEFDRVFDRVWEIGKHQGTDAYDQAIQIIFNTLQIPEIEVFAALKAKGINIKVQETA